MPFKWNREQIEKLIVCIEHNPCIYNTKSIEYLDRTKKALAFNSILKDIQRMESAITLDEIKRKWKNLRTQYMQELRSINQSIKSGAEGVDVPVPKLWCFTQLNFLKTHTKSRTRKFNMNTTIQDKESSMSSLHEEEYLSAEPPKKRQRYLETILSQRRPEKKYAWLGNLVTNQMEDISPENQPDAAWQVQCLMRRLTSQLSYKQQSPSSSSSSKNIIPMRGVFYNEDFD